MLELCLTTFDVEMVKRTVGLYPVNCFAMNPSIAVNDLKGRADFLGTAREIRTLIGEEQKFYLEVMGDTAREMVEDARRIVSEIPGNTLVKIPAGAEGYQAIGLLKREGIRCSCTAIFDVEQALLAAAAGAVCVAVYVSRLDKAGGDGLETVSQIHRAFSRIGTQCMLCAASLKTPGQVEQAICRGAENVTVDLPLLEQMAFHPMTQSTLQTFREDWEGLFGKGVRVANMTKEGPGL